MIAGQPGIFIRLKAKQQQIQKKTVHLKTPSRAYGKVGAVAQYLSSEKALLSVTATAGAARTGMAEH